jgi:hypothetical protein
MSACCQLSPAKIGTQGRETFIGIAGFADRLQQLASVALQWKIGQRFAMHLIVEIKMFLAFFLRQPKLNCTSVFGIRAIERV